jgi:ketosteroid isomerase-like protein
MTNLMSVEVTPLRSLMDQYFEAWGGGMPDEVLSYFSEDAVIHLSSSAGTLTGRKMVGEKWVIPTVTNYPGNIHEIESFLEVGDRVVVDWLFTAAHVSTGKEIRVPGRSEYWVSGGLIRRGNVYFNRSNARV